MKEAKNIALIMAGGGDQFFWPYTNENKTKTFNLFYGEGTLLQNTYERLLKLYPASDIYIITNCSTVELVKKQLNNIADENILKEPSARGTAPCLLLATYLLKDKISQESVITAFPVDHIIYDENNFSKCVLLAQETAKKFDSVVTIGLKPTKPETYYGYLQIDENNDSIGELFKNGVRNSITFAEKPDVATAKRFLEAGDFLWNSGIYIMNCKTIVEQFDKYLPEYSSSIEKIYKLYNNSLANEEEIEKLYKSIEKNSLDSAILEKSDKVLVVKGEFDWTDLNTWDEYFNISKKDSSNSIKIGNVVTLDCNNNLLVSKDKPLAVIGIDNIIAINTPNGILITKISESERVKEMFINGLLSSGT